MSQEDRDQLASLVDAVQSIATSLESIDARLATTLDEIHDKVAWIQLHANQLESDVSVIASR